MASNGLPVRELRTGSDPLGEIAAYRYFMNIDKSSWKVMRDLSVNVMKLRLVLSQH
ncbi:transcriptional regulator LacI family [Vibrio astriarenae]|nr:transcriptional regulator LacI family [Vibrio sp. C7]